MLMMCERPFIRNPSGPRAINQADWHDRMDATPLPCGRCFPCRLNKSRIWMHRMLLEQGQHEKSAFLTLTYNDENLPEGGNLEPKDLTKFWKRLRKGFNSRTIRYFAVGEYGDKNWRPHYHAALYGVCFTERTRVEKAWTNPETGNEIGNVMLGDLTQASARYMTGYIIKNMTYEQPRLQGRRPEFMRSSRGRKGTAFQGGIGYGAINEAGKKIRQNNHYSGDRVRTLQYGKKQLPLGRYLQGHLDNAMCISQETIDADIIAYQQKMFDKHFMSEDYKMDIAMEEERKRKSQRKRHKIFNQRRTI